MKHLLILQDPGVSEESTKAIALKELPGWKVSHGSEPTDHDAVITVNKPIKMEAIRNGMISIAFTGYDHIDLEAAGKLNIAVSNVPGYSTQSVAELAFAMTVMSLRDPRRKNGKELSGKTVGIIGTGAIGSSTANFFKTASCKLLGWSRSENKQFPGKYTSLHDLLENSDVVSIHLPLNKQTEQFMNSERFAMMKRGAILVNTARGGLIDQTKLQELLLSGYLGGAALDVTTPEPLPPDNILHSIAGVVVTPHVGFNTEDALKRRTVEALRNIASWSRGERRNRVD